MASLVVFGLLLVAVSCDELTTEPQGMDNNKIDKIDNGLANTDIVVAFVVFRHGDRTPDLDEMERFPPDNQKSTEDIFFPYGAKALTNKGKQRGYHIGKYLRRCYNNLISGLYLPEEIYVQTTRYARTHMTVLTALAAIYPPQPAQKWNPNLDWQPVPYDTPPYEDDDILYYYNCPRYMELRDQVYNLPEYKKLMKPYEGLYRFLNTKTDVNITTPEDVFFLDNLVQSFENIDVQPPQWAYEVMPQIKEVTLIEFAAEFHTSEMIKLSSGVLLGRVINASDAVISGKKDVPKLWLFSGHENNVAAFMSAIRVFKPHQPKYGATISLELRRDRTTGQYGFTAVYAPNISSGDPGQILSIEGCGEQPFCDYETFVNLTQDYTTSLSDFKKLCSTHVN